ncbi:hypothetical protein DMENIID0001_169580 [Sergentomyia squamirostris]
MDLDEEIPPIFDEEEREQLRQDLKKRMQEKLEQKRAEQEARQRAQVSLYSNLSEQEKFFQLQQQHQMNVDARSVSLPEDIDNEGATGGGAT